MDKTGKVLHGHSMTIDALNPSSKEPDDKKAAPNAARAATVVPEVGFAGPEARMHARAQAAA